MKATPQQIFINKQSIYSGSDYATADAPVKNMGVPPAHRSIRYWPVKFITIGQYRNDRYGILIPAGSERWNARAKIGAEDGGDSANPV